MAAQYVCTGQCWQFSIDVSSHWKKRKQVKFYIPIYISAVILEMSVSKPVTSSGSIGSNHVIQLIMTNSYVVI